MSYTHTVGFRLRAIFGRRLADGRDRGLELAPCRRTNGSDALRHAPAGGLPRSLERVAPATSTLGRGGQTCCVSDVEDGQDRWVIGRRGGVGCRVIGHGRKGARHNDLDAGILSALTSRCDAKTWSMSSPRQPRISAWSRQQGRRPRSPPGPQTTPLRHRLRVMLTDAASPDHKPRDRGAKDRLPSSLPRRHA
jgi:hypothetical protein